MKYYTPQISDLHESFEFLHEVYDQEEDLNFWARSTFSSISGMGLDIAGKFRRGKVRVPFLTKEDIEGEGWEYIPKYSTITSLEFYKDQRWLNYNIQTKEIKIHEGREDYEECNISICKFLIRKVKCRCINDFRIIMKMLNKQE